MKNVTSKVSGLIVCLTLPGLILASCSKPYKYNISSIIDEKTRDEILSISASEIEIDINSPGGLAGASIEIAEFLLDKNVTFNVSGVCNSACPQILLPIADSINFLEKPLIGFHWSIMFDVEYYKKNGGDISQCKSLMNLYNREKEILNHNKLNEDFWKDVGSRIRPYNFKFTADPDNRCDGYDYDVEYFIWYPNSHQLSELYGLSFQGEVCADNFIECGGRIDQLSPEGITASVLIGDKVYVSNGKLKE